VEVDKEHLKTGFGRLELFSEKKSLRLLSDQFERSILYLNGCNCGILPKGVVEGLRAKRSVIRGLAKVFAKKPRFITVTCLSVSKNWLKGF
jgi:hypothetical protein